MRKNKYRFLFLVLLVIAAGLLIGCPEKGSTSVDKERFTVGDVSRESESVSDTATGGNLPVPGNAPILRIWNDRSTSVDHASFSETVESIVGALYENRTMISGVEVVPFSVGSRSIWNEIPKRFIWGDAPGEVEFTPDLSGAGDKERLFKKARESFIAEQFKTFESRSEAEAQAYVKKVNSALIGLRDHLLEPPGTPSPCTRFSELGARVFREQLPLNLVVSDGWADCADESAANINRIMIPGRIAVVQMTVRNDTSSSGTQLAEREKFLRALFPGARIFPSYQSTLAVTSLVRH